MAAQPLFEVMSGGSAAPMIADMAGLDSGTALSDIEISAGRRPARKLAIYPASAGFDLVDELDHLARRTVEPNIFFNPRFLAPAMPRLEDREVRLAVIRDGDETTSRLRFLMPFSVEKPSLPLGVPIVRTWSSPYGPLGAPLIDRDDPVGVIEDFLALLARPELGLPQVLVLPDLRLEGTAAKYLRAAAIDANLSISTVNTTSRAILRNNMDCEEYLRTALRGHHWRDFGRLKRRLSERGDLHYAVARNAEEVRVALEDFLFLEQSGWKGRERTAMASDRFRAAFAREAINGLADQDKVRIHSFALDGRTIASLIVLVEAGVAHTWKTTYDETLSSFSPGVLLMIEATCTHLDDPNIDETDSCAIAGHPVMDRLWGERETLGTLVMGLTPGSDRAARQAATQLHLYSETRAFARRMRDRLRGLVSR